MENLVQIKDRLKKALSIRGITPVELSQKTGIPKSSISQYMSGYAKPKQDRIYIISKALSINEAWLMGYDVDMEKSVKSVQIPVLGSVPAGIPLEAIEDIIDYEEIPAAIAEKGDYFGLKIKGHSMEPQIMDGDTVIVLKVDDVESGDVAIVMVNGDDATCKKVVKQAGGVQLVPFNPVFDPLYFSNEEIISKPVRVIGRVVEIRRSL